MPPTSSSSGIAALDPGSFRDPDSRVVIADDQVLRLLSPKGLADFEALSASDLLDRSMGSGEIVATERAPGLPPGLEQALTAGDVAGVLRHERLPVITYPYEWSFSMLRDAALLQLKLTREALDAGLMVKDATPYNVQFRGAKPVFVDVGSFEVLRPGEPWPGYRQFCELFLYPLMFQAYRGLDFQGFLRASVDGITPEEANRLRSGRDLFRRGVLTHVVLHARLQRRYADSDRSEIDQKVGGSRFSTEVLKANVTRLEKLVKRLTWRLDRSEWSDYRQDNTYEDADNARKREFVTESVARSRRRLVWDVGANDGAYSRLAAAHAELVLAFDIDHLTVDRLYRALVHEGTDNVLPLVFDLADPSPGLGWRGRERRPLEDRARPDTVLALAVLHHLCLGRNVPVAEVVDLFASFGAGGVLEYVEREDPMASRLLSRKGPGANPDYTRENLERLLGERFDVRRSERLPSGTRVLYELAPRT